MLSTIGPRGRGPADFVAYLLTFLTVYIKFTVCTPREGMSVNEQ